MLHAKDVCTGERVITDMGVVRYGTVTGSRGQIDGYRSGGVVVINPRAAVTGDGVITCHAFEAVESPSTAGVGAATAKSGRIVDVVELRTADGLDRSQRIGPNRGIAGHGAGRHVDGDTASDAAWVAKAGIGNKIVATLAVDEVIAL